MSARNFKAIARIAKLFTLPVRNRKNMFAVSDNKRAVGKNIVVGDAAFYYVAACNFDHLPGKGNKTVIALAFAGVLFHLFFNVYKIALYVFLAAVVFSALCGITSAGSKAFARKRRYENVYKIGYRLNYAERYKYDFDNGVRLLFLGGNSKRVQLSAEHLGLIIMVLVRNGYFLYIAPRNIELANRRI